jgi:hypothetical protein
MKLTFTKKLILDSIKIDNGIMIVQFASYLKEEFIERLVKLDIKNNIVLSIYFSSNDYGTATWMREKGFVDSHRWETEDELVKTSYLSKHYPVLLENGNVSEEYIFEKIIPDILWNMIDLDLSFDIFKILKSPNEDIIYSWFDITNKYRKLSDDFINELILKYEEEIKELEILNKKKNEKIIEEIRIKNNEKELLSTKELQYVKNGIQYLSSKFKKVKAFIKNNEIIKETDNIFTPIDNSTEVDDIKEYLERAKRLSRKIKKF